MCHHCYSSVDSSAPFILPLWVRAPSTPSTLLQSNLCYICFCIVKKQKRGRVWPIWASPTSFSFIFRVWEAKNATCTTNYFEKVHIEYLNSRLRDYESPPLPTVPGYLTVYGNNKIFSFLSEIMMRNLELLSP